MGIHSAFSHSAAGHTEPQPLKKIAMIGALAPCGYGGHDPDSKDLTALVNFLADNGLVARTGVNGMPDIEVDVINLAYGRDFLVDPPACDVAVLSYLPSTYIHGLECTLEDEDFSQTMPDMDLRKEFHMVVSPHHTVPQWKQALLDSGARVVVSIGGEHEITVRDFEGLKPFETVLSPEARTYRSGVPVRGLQKNLGLPHPYYGLMLERNYAAAVLRDAAASDAEETPLAERMRRVRSCNDNIRSGNPLKVIEGWFNSFML